MRHESTRTSLFGDFPVHFAKLRKESADQPEGLIPIRF